MQQLYLIIQFYRINFKKSERNKIMVFQARTSGFFYAKDIHSGTWLKEEENSPGNLLRDHLWNWAVVIPDRPPPRDPGTQSKERWSCWRTPLVVVEPPENRRTMDTETLENILTGSDRWFSSSWPLAPKSLKKGKGNFSNRGITISRRSSWDNGRKNRRGEKKSWPQP